MPWFIANLKLSLHALATHAFRRRRTASWSLSNWWCKFILAIILHLQLDPSPVCLFEYNDETTGSARLFGHGFTLVSREPLILQVHFKLLSFSEATNTASLNEVKWCHHPGRQQIHCLHRCLDEESGACLTQVMWEPGYWPPFSTKKNEILTCSSPTQSAHA